MRLKRLPKHIAAMVDALSSPGSSATCLVPAYSKYHNVKVQLDGYTFDSLAEADYYTTLRTRQSAGEISELQVHPPVELIPRFRHNGRWHRATAYELDFIYRENGILVYTDVKGVETAVWKIKAKLLLYLNPGIRFDVIKVGKRR